MRPWMERIPRDPGQSWAFFDRTDPYFDVVSHFHREVELTLVMGGEGKRLVGGTIDTFSEGDLVLLGSNLPHAYWTTSHVRKYHWITVQFLPDFLGGAFDHSVELAAVGHMVAGSGRGLYFPDPPGWLIESACSLRSVSPGRRTARLLEILVGMAESQRRPIADAGQQTSMTGRRLDRILDHIHARHSEPLRVADVAKVAHLSETGFCRFFSRAMGRTFSDYVTSVRLATATHWLLSSDEPIGAVAASAGFANLSYFNRRFLAAHGVTPREFRKLHARRVS
jgi:AraC-like DNA-binding protein